MSRTLFLAFGATVYLIFFATFLYLIGFLANLPQLPYRIDGPPTAWGYQAVLIDGALILGFGLQHSLMARPAFKRAWTRIVPEPIERSIYVLAASAVLILLFVCWQPLPMTIWHVEQPIAAAILWGLFALGWLVVLLSTYLISHFELFGLKQVWLHMRGRKGQAPVLRRPLFYKLVRHPLYSGFFLAFWATPHMTLGHLLLALGMSAYMLIAIRYEERDLIGVFGDDYVRYRQEVGMLTPRRKRRA